jgi:protoporphyrinogen oxidase
LEALISKQKDNMPHSVFFYPKANSQNTFLSSLANGVNIIYDYQVDKIQKNGDKWIINSENVYDLLINTIPLKNLIDYNVSDYAYVIYDNNYHKSVSKIKNYLSHEGLYSIGRFGEWEYYNMDICIESAMKLSNLISCNNELSTAT